MTVPKEMNAGVELLLKRMETNPEEFTQDHKWLGVIRSYKEYLSEQDLKALDDGINGLMQQKFTEIVLEGLVDPKSEKNPYLATANVTHSVGTTRTLSMANGTNTVWNGGAVTGTINANALNLGTATLTDTNLHELLHMKAQMELEKHKAKQVQKTLVGRLKNYLHNE
jgi:hypothetical protein